MKKFLLSLATLAFGFSAYAAEGSIESPLTVAEALEIIENGGAKEAFVKGIITEIEEVSTSYGNATYTIKDEADDETGLKVYRGYYIDGEKFTATDQILVGGTVIVSGELILYTSASGSTTPEVAQGNQIVSYVAPEVVPDVPDAPEGVITVAEAIELIADGYRGEATVSGVITEFTIDTGYGNATYTIKDSADDEEGLVVFRGYFLEGEKFTSEDQLEEGATVIVKGNLTLYGETPEINSGSTILEYSGTVVTPDVPEAPEGVISVAEALELIADGYRGEATVTGIITEFEISVDYGNATYTIKDSADDEEGLVVFRGYFLEGEKFTAEDQLEVGATVVVKGNLTLYGETPEVNTGSSILEYKAPGAGVNGIISNSNAPVEYFNLQGVRISNPSNGLYIIRQGDKTVKAIIR